MNYFSINYFSKTQVITNKKGQIYINLAIAKKLGIQFPLETIKTAKVIKD
jgi:ABC-type uncharacterized transport system substrate-binding protein